MEQEINEIKSMDVPPAAHRTGFSIIIGEHHSHDVHHIAEYIPASSYYVGTKKHYRLKIVSYQYFRTEDDLIAYCLENEIRMAQLPKTSTPGTSKRANREKPLPAVAKKAHRAAAKGNPGREKSTILNMNQLCFCEEYLRLKNATRAYMIAYPSVKNAASAGANANKLKKNPLVKAYLESHKASR